MRHEILAGEIANDPLGRGYAGMTDLEILALLTGEADRPGPVPSLDVKKMLFVEGLWARIAVSTDGADVALRDALEMFESFDLSDPTPVNSRGQSQREVIQEQLSASANVPDAMLAGLLSLGENRRTRAQEIGVQGVTELEIRRAR